MPILSRKELHTSHLARKEAKAATSAKSDFLAKMSHEVRTSMNAILGLAELLGSTSHDAQQLRWLRSFEISAEILMGIIDDILDFSKIESESLTLYSTAFSLPELITNLTELIRPQAVAKGLEMDVMIDESTPQIVTGDPL